MSEKKAEWGGYVITADEAGAISVIKEEKTEDAAYGTCVRTVHYAPGSVKGALREIAKLLDAKYDENWNTRQLGSNLIEVINAMQFGKGLPKDYVPTEKEVEYYNGLWKRLDNYVAQEAALGWLFRENGLGNECMSKNSDINVVMVKCSVLNDFYSTHIGRMWPMAKNIVTIPGFDDHLRSGDDSLIAEIAKVDDRTFYSFATKYCSHHFPDKYPIYDSFVAKVLNDLRGKFSHTPAFSSMASLKDYGVFHKVIDDFRDAYGLSKFSYKEIDRYLWLLGKRYF